MPSLKELREKAGEVHGRMVTLRDEYSDRKEAGKTGAELWPDETRKAWDGVNAEYDALRVEIDEAKRSEDLDSRIDELEREARGDRRQTGDDGEHRNRPGQEEFSGTPAGDENRGQPGDQAEQRDLALQAWFGRRLPACRTEQHMAACHRTGLDPDSDELVLDLYDTRGIRAAQHELRTMHPALIEQRALSGHKGTAGAFAIGSTLVGSLERNMLAFGPMEQTSEIIVTQSGEEMGWPTADDTSNEGEMLGENTATANDEDPTLGLVKWFAYEFSSKALKVPVRLLDDAPSTFAESLGGMLGERLGRAKNRKFTTGTGANQPKGIVTAATLGVTAAAAAAIEADEIIDLEHSIDPAYRQAPGVGFMMHDNVILHVRKLKDGNDQYLWQPGLQEGRPDKLNGRAVAINQHMDSAVATDNKTILFGDLKKYKVRRVRQVVIMRLKERGAEYRQEWFLAFCRADGNLLDAGTAPVKYLQQA